MLFAMFVVDFLAGDCLDFYSPRAITDEGYLAEDFGYMLSLLFIFLFFIFFNKFF